MTVRRPRSVRRLLVEINRIPKNDEHALWFFARRLAHIADRAQGKLEIIQILPDGHQLRLVLCRDDAVRLELGRSIVRQMIVADLQTILTSESADGYEQVIRELIRNAWLFTRCQNYVDGFDVALKVNGQVSSFREEARVRKPKIAI